MIDGTKYSSHITSMQSEGLKCAKVYISPPNQTKVDCGLNSTTLPGPSPLGHLAPLGLLHANHLVAVEQAERVEGGFDLDNVEKIK
jgi:hypothetical protein